MNDSAVTVDRVQPGLGGRLPGGVVAVAALLILGIVAVALVWNRSSGAIEPDTGVPEIDAWVAARNTADIETLRSLSDPDSGDMAWIFGVEVGGLHSLRLLGRADIVTDCIRQKTSTSGTSYQCTYQDRWPLADHVGVETSDPIAWFVRVRNGRVASYQDAATLDPGDPRPSVAFIPSEVRLYLGWVRLVRPEERDNIIALYGFEIRATTGEQAVPEFGNAARGAAVAFEELERFGRYLDRFGSVEKVYGLFTAGGTWVNSVGLDQQDPDVWIERLAEMCTAGVWDPEVASELGEKYFDEDLPLSAAVGGLSPQIPPGEASRTLWIIAAGFCPEDFPEGALDSGPPAP